MTFLELAGKRYSCRNYDSRPVEREKLEKILEAGRIAPSAVNKQPWRFHVFTYKESLNEFYGVYHREWFRTAPCVIAICGDHREALELPDHQEPMVLIPVGYPLDSPDPERHRTKRKALGEIVVYR